MLITDGNGLPLAVNIASASRAEVDMIEDTLDVLPKRVSSPNLVYDRAADSDPLRARLAKQKIQLICPHRKNRTRPPTQDARSLRRYRHRYKIERTFSWLGNKRRLLVRHEHHDHLFHGFAQLACLITVLRRF